MPVWQVPSGGGGRSANGSGLLPPPVCGAGLIFAQPEQLPTICVLAVPLVLIWPVPLVLMALEEFELTNTPQPLFSWDDPVISRELAAVGFRVMTQPPALAGRVPVVARAVTVACVKPSTDEKSCGMSSDTRATTQYEIVTPLAVGAEPMPDWNVTLWRPA